MVFSSMTFLWIFLPLLLVIYYIVKDKYKNYVLLLFSLVFYTWGEPEYIVLMFDSVLINYCIGLLIDKCDGYKRKTLLILSIFINLGLLGYFKYFDFIIMNINTLFGKEVFEIKNIALPIGISFYTFQIMSYIIDLYRKDIVVQKNIFKLALYISFFPQLIAGPIVKYHDIEKQIDERKESLDLFGQGIKRFVYGLGKKVILANTLAMVTDTIFDAGPTNISTFVAWLGAITYTFQIYFDFSGYSDMAIGLGKMFGFKFMENFNYPYLSKSITEFWRRWHISLSTWFREYLYIPLGGNRKGKIRTYINLWIVFLVTGLWHGASWNFIVWGLLHGLFIFIERLGLKKKLDKLNILSRVYTLLVVIVAWIFFRSDTLKIALDYLKVMFTPVFTCEFNLVSIFNLKVLIIIILATLFAGITKTIKEKTKLKKLHKIYTIIEPMIVLIILLISILVLVSNTYNPFIYFRF